MDAYAFLRFFNVALVAIFVFLATITIVYGQHTHEGAVGNFYKTWRQPDLVNLGSRYVSCCGEADCRPIYDFKKTGAPYGAWAIRVINNDLTISQWYTVSDRVWEDQTPDPRESPDGRGHACINAGRVVCAVRASGQ